MILSGLGKQTCAVSDGGEGVHPPTPIPRVDVGSSYRGRGYVGVGRNVWVGADGRTGGRTGGRPAQARLRRSPRRAGGRSGADRSKPQRRLRLYETQWTSQKLLKKRLNVLGESCTQVMILKLLGGQ